jgi:hypothetical protein
MRSPSPPGAESTGGFPEKEPSRPADPLTLPETLLPTVVTEFCWLRRSLQSVSGIQQVMVSTAPTSTRAGSITETASMLFILTERVQIPKAVMIKI